MNKYNSFGLSYADFKERITSIKDTRDAALFATIYCGYARVGEIVKGRYSKNPPVEKEQIKLTKRHLFIDILTEKTGQWRRVPSSRLYDGWLHDPIVEWIEQCQTDALFPYTTRWAQYRFAKHFGSSHIHLLRHWACNHALQGKRTTKRLLPQYVAHLGGWTSINTFYHTYAHFTIEDFIDQI